MIPGANSRPRVETEPATRPTTTGTGALNAAQQQSYIDNGYYAPVGVLAATEVQRFRREFDAYAAEHEATLAEMLPRQRNAIFALTHLSLPWVHEIVSYPLVLDAVESVIGPDILVWESNWFVKLPHDPSYISWHQDGAYWGLTPPHVTTAWIALTASTTDNGALRVLPGSHRTELPQTDTFAPANALSRGQEISVSIEEDQVATLELQPGEMSLHHIGVAHGSKPNDSDHPRIGLAVRYIAADVVMAGPGRPLAQLVRGSGETSAFESIVGPPTDLEAGIATRAEAARRLMENYQLDT